MKLRITIGILLAVASTAYGIVVFMVGSGTGFFLIWFALAVLILLQTFLPQLSAVLPGAGVFWKIIRILLRIFWAAAAVVIVVTWSLIATQFHAKGKPGLDYLIVLGSQVYANGPSIVLRYRLDAAYDYLMDNPDTVCIVSGGQGWNEPAPEANIMKEYLVQKGMESERIIPEDQSKDTSENIRNSREIILDREKLTESQAAEVSVGIVTNNFHVFRGVHLARHAGLSSAVGIAADSKPLYLLNNMLRESIGILKDFVMGNL